MPLSSDGHLNPTFFASAEELRAWFAAYAETVSELWVGYYKKGTGRPSITWPEAVDEALCVGWIDGIRRGIDAERYANRFTPRRPRSIWSAVNVARVAALTAEGRMQPAGLRAFAARTPERTAVYSAEQEQVGFAEAEERQFRAHTAAWGYFTAKPASYRRAATWWVVSAKREATRVQRLATLIEHSATGRTIPPLTRRPPANGA